MTWRTTYQRARAEDGISLIEVLVAVLILGVVLSGLAASIVASLRNAAKNERTAIASAAQTELVEKLQATDWNDAVVYRNELADLPPDLAASLDTSTDPPTFEGDEVAIIEAYPTAADRDGAVPKVKVPQGDLCGSIDITCEAYQLVVFVDRDGDTVGETKRFLSFLYYEDLDGSTILTRFSSERTPVAEEITIVGDARLLTYTLGPSPAALFGPSDGRGPDKVGEIKDRVAGFARFNQGVRNVTMTYQTLKKDQGTIEWDTVPGGNTPGYTTKALTSSGPVEMVGTPIAVAHHKTWSFSLEVSNRARFPDGPMTFTLTAITQDGQTLIHEQVIVFDGSDIDPPGTPPTPSPTTTTTTPTGDPVTIVGDNVTVAQAGKTTPICVANNDNANSSVITITGNVTGLTNDDYLVTVAYDRWTKKNNGTLVPVEDAMTPDTFVNAAGTTFRYTIPAGANVFPEGEAIAFTIKARRPSNPSQNDQATSVTFTSAVC